MVIVLFILILSAQYLCIRSLYGNFVILLHREPQGLYSQSYESLDIRQLDKNKFVLFSTCYFPLLAGATITMN
jgi:hypothetical protein